MESQSSSSSAENQDYEFPNSPEDNMLQIHVEPELLLELKMETEEEPSVKVETQEVKAEDQQVDLVTSQGTSSTFTRRKRKYLDDESDDPSRATRSIQWWQQRFVELTLQNDDDLDDVVVDVYKERKSLCPENLQNRFFFRQVARELVDFTEDSGTPMIWRYAALKLCYYLKFLSLREEEKENEINVEDFAEWAKMQDLEEENAEKEDPDEKIIKVEEENVKKEDPDKKRIKVEEDNVEKADPDEKRIKVEEESGLSDMKTEEK